MNQPTEGRVLLVGEGNFSLSASLIENGTISGPQLTASCIDTFRAVQEAHSLAASNIEFLENAGGTVLFEVDATDLHNHPDIKFLEYERVIFNFPLADRHNIKKNRALLSDFFSSVKNVLDAQKGQIMVTLCKGQGGTPADQPMRSWHDSWQVVSMAAKAGLILTDVCPFRAGEFPRYSSVGFRFQDKGFNTDSALIHVFEVARSVSVPKADTAKQFIRQGNEDFAVPAYVRRKLDRWSLLEKEGHPLCRLHTHLASRLSAALPSITPLHCNHPSLPTVLSTYKSSLRPEPVVTTPVAMDTGEDSPGEGEAVVTSPQTSKEVKDRKNLEKAAGAQELNGSGDQGHGKGFQHGVDRQETAGELQGAASSASSDQAVGASDNNVDFFPALSYPVYVVHPTSRSRHAADSSGSDSKPENIETQAGDSKLEETVAEGGHTGSKMETEEVSSTAPDSSCPNTVTGDTQGGEASVTGDTQSGEASVKESSSSPGDSLFHLRCSLLENLPHLTRLLRTKKKSAAVLMSGLVFRKCPIAPNQLPVSHEMVVLAESDALSADDLTL